MKCTVVNHLAILTSENEMYCHIILEVLCDIKCKGCQIDWCTGNWYFWIKYDLDRSTTHPQILPDHGSNSWPQDRDSTFHVTEMLGWSCVVIFTLFVQFGVSYIIIICYMIVVLIVHFIVFGVLNVWEYLFCSASIDPSPRPSLVINTVECLIFQALRFIVWVEMVRKMAPVYFLWRNWFFFLFFFLHFWNQQGPGNATKNQFRHKKYTGDHLDPH